MAPSIFEPVHLRHLDLPRTRRSGFKGSNARDRATLPLPVGDTHLYVGYSRERVAHDFAIDDGVVDDQESLRFIDPSEFLLVA